MQRITWISCFCLLCRNLPAIQNRFIWRLHLWNGTQTRGVQDPQVWQTICGISEFRGRETNKHFNLPSVQTTGWYVDLTLASLSLCYTGMWQSTKFHFLFSKTCVQVLFFQKGEGLGTLFLSSLSLAFVLCMTIEKVKMLDFIHFEKKELKRRSWRIFWRQLHWQKNKWWEGAVVTEVNWISEGKLSCLLPQITLLIPPVYIWIGAVEGQGQPAPVGGGVIEHVVSFCLG